MELIIQEIVKKVSNSIEEEVIKLMTEGRDISKFILETKKTLDEIGVMIVAEALEIMDEAYRDSRSRKDNWIIKVRISSSGVNFDGGY